MTRLLAFVFVLALLGTTAPAATQPADNGGLDSPALIREAADR